MRSIIVKGMCSYELIGPPSDQKELAQFLNQLKIPLRQKIDRV